MANHRVKVDGCELVVIYTPASERSIALFPGQILCQKVSGGLASSNVRSHCYKVNAIHQNQLRPLPLETHTTALKIPFSHSPNPNNPMILSATHNDLHTGSLNPSLSTLIDFVTPDLTLTTNNPNPRPSHSSMFVLLRGRPNRMIENLERKSED